MQLTKNKKRLLVSLPMHIRVSVVVTLKQVTP